MVGRTQFYRQAWEVVGFQEVPGSFGGEQSHTCSVAPRSSLKHQAGDPKPSWEEQPGLSTDGAGWEHLCPGSRRDTASSRVFLQRESAELLPAKLDLIQFPSHMDIANSQSHSHVCCPKAEDLQQVSVQQLSSRAWGRDPILPVTCWFSAHRFHAFIPLR